MGRSEYTLVCTDQNGLAAFDGIEVHVRTRPFSESYPMEFAFTFGHYSGFASRKVEIVEKIAKYFGDADPHYVVVKTFETEPENRIVWLNQSLAKADCDDHKLVWMKNALLEKDGKVKPGLSQVVVY